MRIAAFGIVSDVPGGDCLCFVLSIHEIYAHGNDSAGEAQFYLYSGYSGDD